MCNTTKKIEEYSRHKRMKDGRSSRCKECSKILHKQYREENKIAIAIKNKIWREKNKEELSLKKKEYYLKNADEKKKKVKEYQQKNREKIKERKRKYRLDNIEIFSKKDKEYYKKNIDKIKEYRKTEKAKNIQINARHKRRSVIKDGCASTNDIGRLKRSVSVCIYCERKFSKHIIKTIDHIIPLSKGGQHELSNLQVICNSCNCKKRNIMPIEFANRIGKLLYVYPNTPKSAK